MTVADLISALSSLEPNRLVVVCGREGGYAEVTAVMPLGLRLYCNWEPGFGPHEVPPDGRRPHALAVALGAAPLPATQGLWGG